jgi:hypothetical protein
MTSVLSDVGRSDRAEVPETGEAERFYQKGGDPIN